MAKDVILVKYLDNPPAYLELPKDTPQEVIDKKVKMLQQIEIDKLNELKSGAKGVFMTKNSKGRSKSEKAKYPGAGGLKEVSGIIGGKRLF